MGRIESEPPRKRGEGVVKQVLTTGTRRRRLGRQEEKQKMKQLYYHKRRWERLRGGGGGPDEQTEAKIMYSKQRMPQGAGQLTINITEAQCHESAQLDCECAAAGMLQTC